MRVPSSGPIPADIMIVGEAPGRDEEVLGAPFVGASGKLLDRLLSSVGLVRTACFVTNVCKHRPPGNDISEWISDRKTPPDSTWVEFWGNWIHPNVANGVKELEDEIQMVQPKLIIALGNTPLLALTGKTGITKWRGSRLSGRAPCPILPALHPAACLRQQELIPVLKADLTRAKRIYEGAQNPRLYKFIIEPTFEQARGTLQDYLIQASGGPVLTLAADIETRLGHIACYGIASSPTDAICVPLLRVGSADPFYWTEDQEVELVSLINQLHQHPNIIWYGQNFLYDCQYFFRWLGTVPETIFDTMIGHNSMYSNTRKGLDFLSSIYAHDHIYWKDESKDWDPSIGERQYWTYNCKDACITWEIGGEILASQIKMGNLPHHEFQQSLFHPVLRMMNRGIRLDFSQRARLKTELLASARDRQEKLDQMAGHHLNPRSTKQLINFFYDDLGIPIIKALGSDSTTTGVVAMQQISAREPALAHLCQTIVELRSLGVFHSTFIEAEPDSDQRMRCSFGIAATTSFRFNSSQNAFGSGMNLQNVPSEGKQKIAVEEYVSLPNIRKLFLSDPGYVFFDMDLDRADLQCVVWLADDGELKYALRENLDMHCLNACALFDIKGIPPDELKETHPNYPEHRGRIGKAFRDKAKQGVHATNYGVGDYKLAQTLGISVHEAHLFRKKWFGAHPGILRWHNETQTQVLRQGWIENPFGARFHLLGRFDLPEFLAWQPQSTVAGVINRALVAIDREEQEGKTSIQLLLQVHDSLAGQFLASRRDEEIPLLRKLGRVEIPYPSESLVIPVGIKTSSISWGDCK